MAYVHPTTGKAVAAQATSLANIGAGAGRGTIIGVLGTAARSSLDNESVTLWREGDIDLGQGALDDLDIGDPVFLSEVTAGLLTDVPPDGVGEVVVQIGHVVPAFREGYMGARVVDKLLRIDTTWLARLGAVAPIAGGG